MVYKCIKSCEDLRMIPVVILTTFEAEADVAKAYNLNANSYLVKPVDFYKIDQLIQELGCYRLACNKTTLH